MWTDLKKAEQHLLEALAIVHALMKINDPLAPTPKIESQRNRAWFKRNNIHLSDVGIEKIFQLFDAGHSCENAAKIMGISLKGAEGQRKKYGEAKRSNRSFSSAQKAGEPDAPLP